MVASSAGAIGSSVRGRDVGDVARLRQTLHRWRAQYGAMEADDTRRFQDFDRENAQLKDGGRGRAHQVDAEGDRREEILTPNSRPGALIMLRPVRGSRTWSVSRGYLSRRR